MTIDNTFLSARQAMCAKLEIEHGLSGDIVDHNKWSPVRFERSGGMMDEYRETLELQHADGTCALIERIEKGPWQVREVKRVFLGYGSIKAGFERNEQVYHFNRELPRRPSGIGDFPKPDLTAEEVASFVVEEPPAWVPKAAEGTSWGEW